MRCDDGLAKQPLASNTFRAADTQMSIEAVVREILEDATWFVSLLVLAAHGLKYCLR